jgi:hypothetical protein
MTGPPLMAEVVGLDVTPRPPTASHRAHPTARAPDTTRNSDHNGGRGSLGSDELRVCLSDAVGNLGLHHAATFLSTMELA